MCAARTTAAGGRTLAGVRLTDFWWRMEQLFGGAYADSVARDQVMPQLGGRTVHEALGEGEDAKRVWRAVCDYFDIPAKDR